MKYLFQKGRIVVATTIALATISTVLSGCSETISESERAEVARLYAEILIAESLYGEDTVSMNHLLDSLFNGTDYKSIEEVEEKIKEIAKEDPEGLRAMFDSTQGQLERIRNNKESDTTTSLSTSDTTGVVDE